jgi:hypothetical protein
MGNPITIRAIITDPHSRHQLSHPTVIPSLLHARTSAAGIGNACHGEPGH